MMICQILYFVITDEGTKHHMHVIYIQHVILWRESCLSLICLRFITIYDFPFYISFACFNSHVLCSACLTGLPVLTRSTSRVRRVPGVQHPPPSVNTVSAVSMDVSQTTYMMTSCHHWPFVWWIQRLPLDSHHKGPVIWGSDACAVTVMVWCRHRLLRT